MSKTRKQRQFETAVKVRARLKLLKALNRDKDLKFEGMLENNNEMNHLMNFGTPRKTNNRKAKVNYRHHTGGYGPADRYSPHDARQMYNIDIDNFEEEVE